LSKQFQFILGWLVVDFKDSHVYVQIISGYNLIYE